MSAEAQGAALGEDGRADRPKPTPEEAAKLRAGVLRTPTLVLDDPEVMRALIAASETGRRNVVDLRGALVSRLETRLAALERTHRSVVAAAYENLAGAGQVHRVVLRALEAPDAAEMAAALLEEAPEVLAVDAARLVVEADEDGPAWAVALAETRSRDVALLPRGGVAGYLALDDTPERDGAWLRPCPPEAELIWGEDAGRIRSEALMRLDVGGERALLAYASEDAARFAPDHGVDLVSFLGGAVGRALTRRVAG